MTNNHEWQQIQTELTTLRAQIDAVKPAGNWVGFGSGEHRELSSSQKTKVAKITRRMEELRGAQAALLRAQ